MSSVLNRMLLIAENKGISPYQLSLKIGVSNSYFYQQKKNSGSVGSNLVIKIIEIFPDISPDWLLTGKGAMLRKDHSENYEEAMKITGRHVMDTVVGTGGDIKGAIIHEQDSMCEDTTKLAKIEPSQLPVFLSQKANILEEKMKELEEKNIRMERDAEFYKSTIKDLQENIKQLLDSVKHFQNKELSGA